MVKLLIIINNNNIINGTHIYINDIKQLIKWYNSTPY